MLVSKGQLLLTPGNCSAIMWVIVTRCCNILKRSRKSGFYVTSPPLFFSMFNLSSFETGQIKHICRTDLTLMSLICCLCENEKLCRILAQSVAIVLRRLICLSCIWLAVPLSEVILD